LCLGLYKLASWALDFDPARHMVLAEDAAASWIFFVRTILMLDRALDFVALPLVVYGLVALLVSRQSLMTALLDAVSRILGVPLYLIDDPERYVKTVFLGAQLGVGGNFSAIVRDLKSEKIAASPPVAEFWNLASGDPVLLGADMDKRPVLVPGGGVIGFLPG